MQAASVALFQKTGRRAPLVGFNVRAVESFYLTRPRSHSRVIITQAVKRISKVATAAIVGEMFSGYR